MCKYRFEKSVKKYNKDVIMVIDVIDECVKIEGVPIEYINIEGVPIEYINIGILNLIVYV
ncbi:hypothetical protein JYG23_06290 [Sedimentibacter sp. zth1]|uniref:hypothetical protein n=1 Tax=Sedimentibacter sp. zth1 TaxID=2816908 RepID=UPI001A927C3B|nr:hypothetical protein [Sedimentibacter sp. zth1]QSX06994.1 hypothetical protein JYG23_06290 [Sedimentibacter sp. zth1]